MREARLLLLLLPAARAVWQTGSERKKLVLDVNFETSKDYDVTSAYAVRGWNMSEGHMKITVPAVRAMHAGRYGMEVQIDRVFSKKYHAQFSLPHFMPRMPHSAYQLTFWARAEAAEPAQPEIAFLDVDEGYDWVGGGELTLSSTWQHIAMDPVYTLPAHKGHEIQIAFLIGASLADYFFDDIQLYEMEVPSPPPPSPPPPPNILLWLDAEGGPKGVQTVIKAGSTGELTADLSSTNAAHESVYGFEVSVAKVFEEDYYGMLSLPAFLVTDHERVYAFSFWAKATGNPKPRPHVTFQDEDNDYAWIDGQYVALSAFWHKYEVNLVVPYTLRGHNVVTNLMLGSFAGTYYFDDFAVSNKNFASPPPSPPSPPPSPPPTVLLQLSLEDYVKGSINPQAYSEGEMDVVVQSPTAAHSGKYGLLITVKKAFDYDWHAQVSLKAFTPPDTVHGYVFSFWGRASSSHGKASMRPKVVFQDKDDEYTPLKQVPVPLEAEWNMYQVDLSIPKHRRNHAIVINFWVGDTVGSFSFDDLQVNIVHQFEPPPPPPPMSTRGAPPPPGVVATLGFETSDEGVTSSRLANNGTWTVSVPDARAGRGSGNGVYVEVERAWKVAALAQLLLPAYKPSAGQETLLHLSFWAKAEKLKSSDPTPCVTVAFVDLKLNNQLLGSEEILITSASWQLYYVLVDLKPEHLNHLIKPYLYLGKAEGIYLFDDFEYKEIEIEDGMRWLQGAPERIKHKRMGRFRLTFRDKDDWPIDYGRVGLELQAHAFPFGVALPSALAADEAAWYRATAARHFWTGTLHRALLWDAFEPSPGDVAAGRRLVDEWLGWARAAGWAPLAAALFDGGHADATHWSNKLTCKDLEEHIHERIARELRALGGRVGRYEVWKDEMRYAEWTRRCGQGLYFAAYRWAHAADGGALLSTSEAEVLSPLMLTNAEAYHNLLWEMAHEKKVPLHGIGVQAHFDGPIDASTVKHRLDVLREVQLPVYITELSISIADPAKHAYEVEKFLRIAFSHEAVAGITMGDLWDKSAAAKHSGIYTTSKQPKPAVASIDKLWREEWHTLIDENMHSDGTLDFEGFYGTYKYQLTAGNQVCTGSIELNEEPELNPAWSYNKRSQDFVIKCDFKGQLHVPVWATPACIALVCVGCLLGCWYKRRELVHTIDHTNRYDKAPTRQS